MASPHRHRTGARAPGEAEAVDAHTKKQQSSCGSSWASPPTIIWACRWPSASTNADGVAEIMVGAGAAGGGSQVRVLNSFGGLIKSFSYTSGNVNSPVRLALRLVDDRILLYAAAKQRRAAHEIRLFDPATGTLVDNFFEFKPTSTAALASWGRPRKCVGINDPQWRVCGAAPRPFVRDAMG